MNALQKRKRMWVGGLPPVLAFFVARLRFTLRTGRKGPTYIRIAA